MFRMMRTVAILSALLTCLLLTGCPQWPYGQAVYVDKDSTAWRRDGRTWATAYHTIQQGIDTARQKRLTEVWVAGGVYDEERFNATGSLALSEGINLYGGFAGTESNRTDRDWAQHVTVIDGSSARDGEPAYHVIVGADAILDGFTIRGGRAVSETEEDANGYGGGMFNSAVSPTVINCTFENNTAELGGAIFSTDATVALTNCTFRQNTAGEAGQGGAVFNSATVLDMTYVTFVENQAGQGGGMFNSASSMVNALGVTFTDNWAESGGGMFNSVAVVTMEQTTFSQNLADMGGGIFAISTSGTLTNCVFAGNEAVQGGAIFNSESSQQVSDSVFTRNSADLGGGVYNVNGSLPAFLRCVFEENSAIGVAQGGAIANSGSTPTVTQSTFVKNTGLYGGAIFNESSAGEITDCVFLENAATQGGAQANTNASSPTFTRCSFMQNAAADSGGALFNFEASVPLITECVFSGNTAESFGGAIQNHTDANAEVTRCTFIANAAGLGGAVANYAAAPVITNCVLSRNTATSGAAVYNQQGTAVIANSTLANNEGDGTTAVVLNYDEGLATIANCILWNPAITELPLTIRETFDVSYSDVRGKFSGTGNIDADPLFVYPNEDDYTLTADSPCIDTGRDTSGAEFGGVTEGIAGNSRGIDGDAQGTGETGDGSDYDMGAYEYAP